MSNINTNVEICHFTSRAILIALGLRVKQMKMERNASNRALTSRQRMGLAETEEIEGSRQVLRTAAFTNLAALGPKALRQVLATFTENNVQHWSFLLLMQVTS